MFRTVLLPCFFLSIAGVLLAREPMPPFQQSGDVASAKPAEHVLGTVTAVDPGAQTITVRDDKTGLANVISVAGTKTLLKVPPGAKDLKSAVRITGNDLQVGDRVDVRGYKADPAATTVQARSVVLMSARALAAKREAEAAAWQNSTVGTVTAVNPAAGSLAMTVRTPEGPKPITLQGSANTEWSRYSPANPNTAAHSALDEIQPGDQVRVIGQKNPDGTSIAADKVYSAPVRNIAATVVSVSPDGKDIVAKNIQTKQNVTIALAPGAAVRKLDPQMAAMMAHRFAANAASNGSQPSGGPRPTESSSSGNGPGTPGVHRGGDLSHLLERIPEVPASTLQPGNAIVVWGLQGQNPDTINAQTVLAGVEPILQSAPPRQGQSLSADWGLDVSAPAQ